MKISVLPKDVQRIVIDTQNRQQIDSLFLCAASEHDEIILLYDDRFALSVEWVVRNHVLKATGWLLRGQGFAEEPTLRCKHKLKDKSCSLAARTEKETNLRCVESVRQTCRFYEQLDHSMQVRHFIHLEKSGNIRDLN